VLRYNVESVTFTNHEAFKNGVIAFSYYSAESEQICMKSGALSRLLGAGPGRFWAEFEKTCTATQKT